MNQMIAAPLCHQPHNAAPGNTSFVRSPITAPAAGRRRSGPGGQSRRFSADSCIPFRQFISLDCIVLIVGDQFVVNIFVHWFEFSQKWDQTFEGYEQNVILIFMARISAKSLEIHISKIFFKSEHYLQINGVCRQKYHVPKPNN